MIADGLDRELDDLLKNCLKKKNAKSREHVRANVMNSVSISPKIGVSAANCKLDGLLGI